MRKMTVETGERGTKRRKIRKKILGEISCIQCNECGRAALKVAAVIWGGQRPAGQAVPATPPPPKKGHLTCGRGYASVDFKSI